VFSLDIFLHPFNDLRKEIKVLKELTRNAELRLMSKRLRMLTPDSTD
jgi:hypothetical protein